MFVIFSVRLSIDLITTSTLMQVRLQQMKEKKIESSASAARDCEPTFATCSVAIALLSATDSCPPRPRDENLPKSESSSRKSAIASARLVRRLINHRGRASSRGASTERKESEFGSARPLSEGSLLLSIVGARIAENGTARKNEETEGRIETEWGLCRVVSRDSCVAQPLENTFKSLSNASRAFA